jgi:hypothetical protein
MQNIATSFAALVTASIVVWVGVRYCIKVIRRQINPTVTTWIIFEIGVVMSLVTYFTSHNHSIVKAINNASDGFVVTAILTTLLIKGQDKKIVFSDNEKTCLKIAVASLVMWALTRTSWIGFAGFQVVMIVAYFPMFENLWRWEPGNPPEPADMWGITAMVSAIGVCIDITGMHHDYVAMLYPLRACVLSMVVLALIRRWKKKNSLHRIT